jgi:uncharacterized membrane protein YdjX (TVP38/TMEM64 family)
VNRRLRPLHGGILLILLLILIVGSFGIPWNRLLVTIQPLLQQVEALGFWGPLLFVGIYILFCLFLVPASPLSFLGGFLFGLPVGFLTITLGSLTGTTLVFFLGRKILRKRVESWMSRWKVFPALDRAVSREGFRLLVLIRLSPVLPFNLLNYGLGLTRIRLRDFFFGSWIGMAPITFLYVYIGSSAKDFTQLSSRSFGESPVEQIFFAFGLVATLLLVAWGTRLTRRALKSSLSDNSPEPISG